MTKDAIELRLNLVAEMLQKAVNEITGVLTDLDDASNDKEQNEAGHGPQDS